MNEQLKKIIDPIKGFWGKLTPKIKKTIMIGGVSVIVLAIVLSLLLNREKFVVLYPSLDSDETIEVVNEIKTRGISYKESDGTIYVPESEEESLRMDLSNQGHPYSTYNYDFFLNNVNAMTTDSEKKILEKYQLNQKLESVIKSIKCINRATVTLNIPEDSGYVLSTNKNDATAAVTVTLNQGDSLSSEQVLGIKNLVSKSVPNLTTENVTIVDTATGKELNGGDSLQVDKSTFKMQMQSQYEESIEDKISNILIPIYGDDNLKIVAKSDIDVDKSIKDITTYVPSQDNSGVISKQEESYQKTGDGSTTGGAAGTDSNTGTPTYSEISSDDSSIYINGNNSYEYLVSKIQEQIQNDSAKVLNLTVSIVVNTDGLGENAKSDIANLAANAAGINATNVFVLGSKFLEDTTKQQTVPNTPEGLFSQNTLYLALAIVIGLILLVIIIMIVLRMAIKKNKKKSAVTVQHTKKTIKSDSGVDESEEDEKFEIGEIKPKENKTEALKAQIKTFTGDNPEIAAQLIRTWLKGKDAND